MLEGSNITCYKGPVVENLHVYSFCVVSDSCHMKEKVM